MSNSKLPPPKFEINGCTFKSGDKERCGKCDDLLTRDGMRPCGFDQHNKVEKKSTYTFEDKDGRTMELDGSLTIEDLVKMGFTDIRIEAPETPLKPGDWRSKDD